MYVIKDPSAKAANISKPMRISLFVDEVRKPSRDWKYPQLIELMIATRTPISMPNNRGIVKGLFAKRSPVLWIIDQNTSGKNNMHQNSLP